MAGLGNSESSPSKLYNKITWKKLFLKKYFSTLIISSDAWYKRKNKKKEKEKESLDKK